MAVIYATLIVKGKKTFNQVPMKLKDQVKEILIDLEVPELAEQPCKGKMVLRYRKQENRLYRLKNGHTGGFIL